LQDKEGYTPLHIAAGYLNRGVVRLLLSAGADPELSDRMDRSALDLIVALKQNTPTTPDFFARRGALDEVAKELETHLYEELEPRAILAKRTLPNPKAGEDPEAGPGPTEYLVLWSDGSEETWEPERNVADDVIADFEAGLEYASAKRVLERRRGAVNEYLVEVRQHFVCCVVTLAPRADASVTCAVG
jgi:signal recognition particle protein